VLPAVETKREHELEACNALNDEMSSKARLVEIGESFGPCIALILDHYTRMKLRTICANATRCCNGAELVLAGQKLNFAKYFDEHPPELSNNNRLVIRDAFFLLACFAQCMQRDMDTSDIKMHSVINITVEITLRISAVTT
jgi:hypothetical protein